MRLSQFVLDVVATRKLPLLSTEKPLGSKPPSVLMKMDIEGRSLTINMYGSVKQLLMDYITFIIHMFEF